MQVKEVMSKNVEVLDLDTDIIEAAKKMKEINSGAIPICDEETIQGILTDRDIVVKCLADGKDAHECRVRDIMTSPIQYIFDDQNVEDAAEHMREQQVRRLVVVDREKKLVGIVSLGDLALKAGDHEMSAKVLKSVTEGDRGSLPSDDENDIF